MAKPCYICPITSVEVPVRGCEIQPQQEAALSPFSRVPYRPSLLTHAFFMPRGRCSPTSRPTWPGESNLRIRSPKSSWPQINARGLLTELRQNEARILLRQSNCDSHIGFHVHDYLGQYPTSVQLRLRFPVERCLSRACSAPSASRSLCQRLARPSPRRFVASSSNSVLRCWFGGPINRAHAWNPLPTPRVAAPTKAPRSAPQYPAIRALLAPSDATPQ